MYSVIFKMDNIGEITIGSFVDSFESDFVYWSKEKYEAQWIQARALAASGKSSAFVTLIGSPESMNFMRWWLCYRMGSEYIFQEHILFLEDIGEFKEEDLYSYIPEYASVTEEGDKVSEWRVLG